MNHPEYLCERQEYRRENPRKQAASDALVVQGYQLDHDFLTVHDLQLQADCRDDDLRPPADVQPDELLEWAQLEAAE